MKATVLSLVFILSMTLTPSAIAQKTDWFQKVGVVSYTYRNSFSKDVALTLDTIKSLGLTDIEFSNLFGKTAKEVRSLLDERGLTCSSFGVSYQDLVNKTDEVGENAKTLGASFVRVAWIPHDGPFTIDHLMKAVSDFNSAGETLRKKFGLTFCYHNHGYEFQQFEKGTLFDVLVAKTDPKNVSFELDILWAAHPGADPAKLMKQYGPRFKLMHVKDLRKGVKGDFSGNTDVRNDVVLGTGQINIPAVVEALPKTAMQHLYIEDENPDASKQVPQSIAYLRKLLVK